MGESLASVHIAPLDATKGLFTNNPILHSYFFQNNSPIFQPFHFSFAFLTNTVRLNKPIQTNELQHLIQECIKGNAKAQKKLYAQYMPAMYNRAVRMLADREQAKDIIQEVFVLVFKDLARFRGESTIGAWIKRITINQCLNALKASSKMNFVAYEDRFDRADEKEEAPQYDIQLVHRAIQELPEGCRTVFNLYLLEGYLHKEIAEILDISESTSKTQFRRAKKLLLENLKSTNHE